MTDTRPNHPVSRSITSRDPSGAPTAPVFLALIMGAATFLLCDLLSAWRVWVALSFRALGDKRLIPRSSASCSTRQIRSSYDPLKREAARPGVNSDAVSALQGQSRSWRPARAGPVHAAVTSARFFPRAAHLMTVLATEGVDYECLDPRAADHVARRSKERLHVR